MKTIGHVSFDGLDAEIVQDAAGELLVMLPPSATVDERDRLRTFMVKLWGARTVRDPAKASS